MCLSLEVQQSSFYGYTGMLPKRYTQGVMTGESEYPANLDSHGLRAWWARVMLMSQPLVSAFFSQPVPCVCSCVIRTYSLTQKPVANVPSSVKALGKVLLRDGTVEGTSSQALKPQSWGCPSLAGCSLHGNHRITCIHLLLVEPTVIGRDNGFSSCWAQAPWLGQLLANGGHASHYHWQMH